MVVQEYETRLARIRTEMQAQNLDALLLTKPENVWYVSGFWEFIPIRMEAVLVPCEGDCVFLVSKNEHEYATKTSWITDIRYYVEFPETGKRQDPIELVSDVIAEKRLTRSALAVEKEFMPVNELARWQRAVPNAQFLDASPILEKVRMVKSPYEIDLLKKAGQVAVSAWRASLRVAKPGMREFEVAQAAREAATLAAASFLTDEEIYNSPLVDGVQLIQAGPRSSISHGRGSRNRLRPHDLVAMCFCMTNQFKGYRVGFSRNFSLGSPTTEELRVYSIAWEAQQAALAALQPGVTASHLDRIVRRIIHDAGYGAYIQHRLGRGVGLEIAEKPNLKEGDDTILQAGMTLSIEPAMYLTGRFGVQIEDSVVVTPEGYEFLTVAPEPELPVL